MYHLNFSCDVSARRVRPKRRQLDPDGLPIRALFGGAQVAVSHAIDQLRAPEVGGGAIGYPDLVSPPLELLDDIGGPARLPFYRPGVTQAPAPRARRRPPRAFDPHRT